MIATSETRLHNYLRWFVRDGIISANQKKALKAAGFISWGHGIWALTDFGKAEAERLGYL